MNSSFPPAALLGQLGLKDREEYCINQCRQEAIRRNLHRFYRTLDRTSNEEDGEIYREMIDLLNFKLDELADSAWYLLVAYGMGQQFGSWEIGVSFVSVKL